MNDSNHRTACWFVFGLWGVAVTQSQNSIWDRSHQASLVPTQMGLCNVQSLAPVGVTLSLQETQGGDRRWRRPGSPWQQDGGRLPTPCLASNYTASELGRKISSRARCERSQRNSRIQQNLGQGQRKRERREEAQGWPVMGSGSFLDTYVPGCTGGLPVAESVPQEGFGGAGAGVRGGRTWGSLGTGARGLVLLETHAGRRFPVSRRRPHTPLTHSSRAPVRGSDCT